MGSVFRATYTKALPAGAELFTRKGGQYARWEDSQGRRRTAPTTTSEQGKTRILLESRTFFAQYRDGEDRVVRVTTGCRTRDAARAVLAELEARADKVRSGSWTASEDAVLDHQHTSIGEHVEAYLAHLARKRVRGRVVSPQHCANVRRSLTHLVGDCGFERLRDLSRDAVESWARDQEAGGMAPRTINTRLVAITAFGNWAVRTNRLVTNPFTRVEKAEESSDRRRQRRGLTESELLRLLDVAHRRPVAELGRERAREPSEDREGRRTRKRESLTLKTLDAAEERARTMLAKKPARREKLERLGRERALIYKTMVLTGLRKAELASLTTGRMELDDERMAFAVLAPADEKSGKGARIPLRADLVCDLRDWIADMLARVRSEARAAGRPIPARLPADTRLFNVPSGLIRILDRDLGAAGILKVDDRGRTVDVHALRTTFASHLSRAGVAPRTAQAALRHSTLDLTMNVYTDPQLLDVAGALDVLPELPLGSCPSDVHRAQATGTDGRELAPKLALNSGSEVHSSQLLSRWRKAPRTTTSTTRSP